MANINTLKKIAKISKYTGFTSICYFLNRNRKRTVAYHNIIPDKYFDNTLHLDYSMKESNFKKQIELIKSKFDINLDINDTKSLTLTFDDGYSNQCKIASRIMDKENVKGYFFCVANLINDNEILTMDKLQYWFSYVPLGVYKSKELNLEFNISTNEGRREEWKKVSDALKNGVSIKEAEEYLNDLYGFKDINMDEKFYRLRFYSIEKYELEDMKKKGHKIGAHSANHIRLSDLKQDELEEDIKICGDMLKNKIYNTKVFCYPYGSIEDISEVVINQVKNNGFESAFAYSNLPLNNGKEYNQYFIPRIFLPDTDDKDLIDFVLSGAKHFITFRKLLP